MTYAIAILAFATFVIVLAVKLYRDDWPREGLEQHESYWAPLERFHLPEDIQ